LLSLASPGLFIPSPCEPLNLLLPFGKRLLFNHGFGLAGLFQLRLLVGELPATASRSCCSLLSCGLALAGQFGLFIPSPHVSR
jgi:hypothetical protein